MVNPIGAPRVAGAAPALPDAPAPEPSAPKTGVSAVVANLPESAVRGTRGERALL
jgi:hypothetical protein